MAKKIPIVGVDVTSNISGTVQPLGPMFGGSAVYTNSLQSIVDSKPSIIYADSAELSALISIINEIIGTVGLVLSDTYDAALIQEIVTLLVSKRFNDQVGPISDLITQIIFNKGIFSPVSPNDVLTRTVDFNRAFSDIGILSDKPSIGYSKPLTDSISSINDTITTFDFSKVVINLANVSDNFNRVVNFIRKPEDTLIIGDRPLILTSKSLIDNISLSDFLNTIDFTKGNFETLTVSEESIIDFNKPLSDISVIQDLTPLSITKPFADLFSINDSDTIDFTKSNFETVLTSDRNDLVFAKALIEALQPLDFSVIDVQKILSDSVNVPDFDAIDFTKVNVDAANIESFMVLNNMKFISDIQLIEDENILNFEKNVFDSITANSFSKFDFIKVFADIATVEDLTNIFDGSNYAIDKTVADVVITDENLSRIVDFNRIFQDNQLANELLIVDFNKILESFANNNDSLAFNTSLFKTDSIDSINDVFKRVIEYRRSFTDTQSQNDNLTFSASLVKTDSIISNDILNRTVVFNRSFNDTQSQNDLSKINVAKVLTDSTVGFNDVLNRTVVFNRSFNDTQSQNDLSKINVAKVLSDVNSTNDDEILSITKVLSDLSNITDKISTIDFNKHIRLERVIILDLFDRTVSFNRSLTDAVLQPDLAALSVTKPFSDAIGHVDGPIQFDSDGWAVDYVVSGYIFDTRVVFNIIKAIADINSTVDNDVYSLSKVLANLIDPQDNDVIDFTKARTDEIIILDDDVLDFTKALAEVIIQPDGPVQFGSDGWAVDYVVSGYIFDTRAVFSVIKPLTDLTDPQDANVINFTKSRSDENITLDDDVLDFTKALADAAIDNLDGPIQYDSNGWAVDYVVSGYIFDTRVVFDVIKALSDINSTEDNDVYDLAKVLSDLTSDLQDADTINFTKATADETIILDDDIFEFTKPLVDILGGSSDGPIQFDSDGWAVDYVVSGYIFDTRAVFSVIKPLTDTVQQPDDTDVFNLNKVLADFNNQSDSNKINFTKALADNTTPLDNIDVFDGSTHSLAKAVADTAPPIDSKVIQFTKVLADSANLVEAGKIINQNYIDHTYFAEDYIGEVRLIA